MADVTSAAIMCNFYPQFITKVTRVGFPACNFKDVIILKAAWMGEQIMLRISLLSIPFPLHNSPLEFRQHGSIFGNSFGFLKLLRMISNTLHMKKRLSVFKPCDAPSWQNISFLWTTVMGQNPSKGREMGGKAIWSFISHTAWLTSQTNFPKARRQSCYFVLFICLFLKCWASNPGP